MTMPNGSSATHHYLDNLSITDTTVTATVSSRTAAGTMCWQDRISLDPGALTGDPYAAALTTLTGSDGYLAGGIVQDDPTPLDQLRATMLTRLARMRDDHLTSGCQTAFGRIDTDLVSRQNISGAVSMATIARAAGEAFSIRWRMRDNQYVELDADEMIQVGVTVGQYISAVYAASFAAKDEIDAAGDVAELQSVELSEVVWPA